MEKNILKQSAAEGETAFKAHTATETVKVEEHFKEVPGKQAVESVNSSQWNAATMKTAAVQEDPMDPAIMKEMSSWSVIKSEDDKHHLKLRYESGKDMASVIRFKEEAAIKAKFGEAPKKLTGSLTEGQLFEMMKGVRDKPKTFTAKKIAEDFEISVGAADVIIKCARFPKIETTAESIDMFIAK